MKHYRKPDLNAPRYRPKKLNLLNADFYNRFIQENPKHIGLTIQQFKDIITTFNGMIWKAVIEFRDGVDLPEQLGYLFIGTCPPKKKNVDFDQSAKYGKKIQSRNFESDQYLAKIFYTNYETKYRFRNNELWGFVAIREFKRTTASTYPKEWKKYIVVDPHMKISRLFRKETKKHDIAKETEFLLQDYDEFNLI